MHPFFRAYLAGIAVPTMLIPLAVAAVVMDHGGYRGFALESVAIIPIGLAPSAWGLWNMLHVGLRRRWDLPIGLFGAALAIVLVPLAFSVQLAMGKTVWTPPLFAVGFPITLVAYYLAWKHVVARINALLGIG